MGDPLHADEAKADKLVLLIESFVALSMLKILLITLEMLERAPFHTVPPWRSKKQTSKPTNVGTLNYEA